MLLQFGDYELDTELFELRHAGQVCQIEPQVFDLLLYLAQHRDRIISRQELLDNLWAGKIVSEATLNSRIKAARQAIGDNGQAQHSIATLNRRGYRFVAAVVQRESLGATPTPNSTASEEQANKPQHERPTLAVLPFAHNHGSERIAWLAEMFSTDISIQLARIPGFLVISRNSCAYYQDREYTITQVGQELGTDYVIEGSVWEIDNQLRVSIQLLDTTNGRILWAHRNEIPADKLAEFQDEVVREIVNRIEPELNRAELASLRQHRPVDLGAWALYRQAHALLGIKGWSEETFSEAADLLRQALVKDPQLAFAHAYLALVLALGHLIGLVKDTGTREEAMRAAEVAIDLDSQDPDVLGYVGCALADLGEYQRGISLMQRATELDPSNAQAHAALGAALLRLGKTEGVEMMRYGMRISPLDNRLAVWGAVLARALLSLGHIDEAIETAEYVCRCDDKIFLPRVILAIAQYSANNITAAQTALQDARRIRPRLNAEDLKPLASPEEIDGLIGAGLLS